MAKHSLARMNLLFGYLRSKSKPHETQSRHIVGFVSCNMVVLVVGCWQVLSQSSGHGYVNTQTLSPRFHCSINIEIKIEKVLFILGSRSNCPTTTCYWVMRHADFDISSGRNMMFLCGILEL